MIDLATAILNINDKAQFHIINESIDEIEWLQGTSPISKADILEKQTELRDEFNANKYQRDRVYATWQEQMDQQYWDQINGTTNWKDAIAKVKADNPKPS